MTTWSRDILSGILGAEGLYIMPLFRRVAVVLSSLTLLTVALGVPALASAQAVPVPVPVPNEQHRGGEINLVLPDLSSGAVFFGGISGASLLRAGLVIAALGLVFGLIIYQRLQNMPVH